ncbi:hypothetical protein WKW80_32540 [Variovorax humicola]|uniref:Uncharacterized protein n=1 Tax=Variovorax humicola TaxID=1769758 RepID=A0ABU8W9J1_9BURK
MNSLAASNHVHSHIPYGRAQCLAALSGIAAEMDSSLEQARRLGAERCLKSLRAILVPFDLGRHEVRIHARADSTCLSVNLRQDNQCGRLVSDIRGDSLLLDVLQEIDDFLYAHEDWVQYLDGAVLNMPAGSEQAPARFSGTR